MKFEWIQTCYACPEQYEVFYNNRQVSYVRLRWGKLTASFPDFDGEPIYNYKFYGEDGLKGHFDNDIEREFHKNEIEIILRRILK